MTELEMIKAFAELEGVTATVKSHFNYENGNIESLFIEHKDKSVLPSIIRGGKGYSEYNPITDLALNCAARDNYEVSIEYGEHSDFISIGLDFYSEVMDRNVVPKAVIECILKSKGLWQ